MEVRYHPRRRRAHLNLQHPSEYSSQTSPNQEKKGSSKLSAFYRCCLQRDHFSSIDESREACVQQRARSVDQTQFMLRIIIWGE
jgi:hypothetical protein